MAEADFTADLASVIAGTANPEYREPARSRSAAMASDRW